MSRRGGGSDGPHRLGVAPHRRLFALYAVIAVVSRARSMADFYVADRAVNPMVSGMATGADWMSAASFMSMAGILAFTGRDGAAYLMGWTGGYVLLAVLLAPYLRKYGKYTVPQFVGRPLLLVLGPRRRDAVRAPRLVHVRRRPDPRRGHRARPVPRGAGRGGDRHRSRGGVPVRGARGDEGHHARQVTQYLVVIIAFLVPAILVSRLLTGNSVPPLGLGDRLGPEGAALLGVAPGRHLLDALDGIGADLGLGRFTGGSRPRLDVVATTAALMIGTAGLPHIIIRFFTVPKIRDARASAGWALVFIAILYTAAPAVGAFGRGLLVATVHGVPHASAPSWWTSWEETGLVGWTDRNGDGVMQLSGDPARNEVRVDRDVVVLAHPEMAQLPAWVVGLVAAGRSRRAWRPPRGSSSSSPPASRTISSGASWRHASRRAPSSSGRAPPPRRPRSRQGTSRSVRRDTSRRSRSRSASRPPPSSGPRARIFWRRATKEGAIAGMVTGLALTAGYAAWFHHFHPESQPARALVARDLARGLRPRGHARERRGARRRLARHASAATDGPGSRRVAALPARAGRRRRAPGRPLRRGGGEAADRWARGSRAEPDRMATIEPIAYVRSVSPFAALPAAEFETAARSLEIGFYPAGTRLATAGGLPSSTCTSFARARCASSTTVRRCR